MDADWLGKNLDFVNVLFIMDINVVVSLATVSWVSNGATGSTGWDCVWWQDTEGGARCIESKTDQHRDGGKVDGPTNRIKSEAAESPDVSFITAERRRRSYRTCWVHLQSRASYKTTGRERQRARARESEVHSELESVTSGPAGRAVWATGQKKHSGPSLKSGWFQQNIQSDQVCSSVKQRRRIVEICFTSKSLKNWPWLSLTPLIGWNLYCSC